MCIVRMCERRRRLADWNGGLAPMQTRRRASGRRSPLRLPKARRRASRSSVTRGPTLTTKIACASRRIVHSCIPSFAVSQADRQLQRRPPRAGRCVAKNLADGCPSVMSACPFSSGGPRSASPPRTATPTASGFSSTPAQNPKTRNVFVAFENLAVRQYQCALGGLYGVS